jgi:hypothetical protein
MTKPGDLPTTKKTIHELAKEFPEKTYRELEKYRDADRQEEAQQIPLSESQKSISTDGDEQDNPTLWEIAKELKVSYADAVPIQEDMRLKRDALKAACTIAEMRKDRTPLGLMKKRAQEAEGELKIIKGIGNTSPEIRDAKKEIEELKKEVKSLKWIKDHDYTFLIDENKKLHAEIKRLKEGTVDRARKAGL